MHALYRILFVLSELTLLTATLAVTGELYACECARMDFGNRNFCTERGRDF